MSLSREWIMCCVCKKKVKNVDTQVWVEDEAIIEKLKGIMISHGYCEECFKVAFDEVREACDGS